jgi:hypothetical protein
MATTYTGQNAYDDALTYSRNITIPSATQIRLVDSVNSEIWTYFPWPWTLQTLTAISLAANTQDYALSGSDTNFRSLTKAWITRTDTAPDKYYGPLSIVDYLLPELDVKGVVNQRQIAYQRVAGNLRFRLEYSVVLGSGVAAQIDGEYWGNPTKITSLSSTFNFPDEFFTVLVKGLIYYISRWAGDSRAGGMQMDRSGNRTFTGAWASYQDALLSMAASYDMVTQFQSPSEPLGAYRGGSPALYGI